MAAPVPDSVSRFHACAVFPVADLRFALAWSQVAPGLGGWQAAVTQISSGEMVDVIPPGAEFPVFCILPRTGHVELVRERSIEVGGGQVAVARCPTLRDALLLLCPLSQECLADIEAGRHGGLAPVLHGIDGCALRHDWALIPSSAEMIVGTMMNAARLHTNSPRPAPKSCGHDLRRTFKVAEVPVVRRIPSAPDDSSLLRPVVGDEAAGYGMNRRIAAVPDWQPLGHDEIWRVVLAGEVVVRVVRHSSLPGVAAHWQLLQMDDMTDEQLDIYEAALSDPRDGSQG